MNIGFDAKRIFHNRTGLGNYGRDITRIMSEYFPENSYFLYNPKPSASKLFTPNGVNVFEISPRKPLSRFFYNFWRQYGVGKELIRDKIDLFHGLSGEIPIKRKGSNIPVIVTVHDLIFLRFPQFYSFFDRKIHQLKHRHACRNADMVVAVSEQTKRDVVKFFGVPEEKVKVIYQGCQDVFKQAYEKEEIERTRKNFGLPEQYILNVGTIEERKNILAGVKAIKDIDTHLAIVGGKTPYTQKVKDYITENKMEGKVTFLKGVSNRDLAILYQGASLFVYPSFFEGFGIPIIEALFSETPVITSKGGCFGEAGGEGALYIDPENVEELSDAIKTVLFNQEMQKKLIENGRKHIKIFSDEYIGSQYMELYKMLVSK
ncbi:glycosyltransferase family 4 protein [Marinilabilia rubra]|uniref:Glycosyl transferase family 1 n=1 Tax=Marinilabilia rubra TaxID=2162893 RepID=A0A2U2B8Q7_9BACT|nr:glycosyltransferase family 1 protein [Marinilabilia rubra]PWD99426.1 glycosyl transferase family 1 [Marinilabilia rubra]